MKRFDGRIYANSQKGCLVWEPSWETFRPVISVVLNPLHNQYEPFYGIYIHDIFDVHYGFQTEEIHDYCVEFTDKNLYDIENADDITIEDFWRYAQTKLTWFQDRAIAVHPCAGPLDRKKYLARYSLRSKTFKRAPRNLKGTRKMNTHQ